MGKSQSLQAFLMIFVLAVFINGYNGLALYGELQQNIPDKYMNLSAEQLNKIGLGFHRKKDFHRSRTLFRYSVIRDKNYTRGYFNIACASSLLNEPDTAIDALERAAAINRTWVLNHIKDPDLNNIRGNPRFKRIISGGKGSSPLLAGQKFCRERTAPDDVGYEITFLGNGRITGTINQSDNCNYSKLSGGSWSIKGKRITIELNIIDEKVCSTPGDPLGTKKPRKEILKFNSVDEMKKTFPDGC